MKNTPSAQKEIWRPLWSDLVTPASTWRHMFVFVGMIPFERAHLATFQCPSFSWLPIAHLCAQAILINSCLQRSNLTQQMFKSQHTCNLIWDIFWLLHSAMWDRHSIYIPLGYGFVYKCTVMFESSFSTVHSFIINYRFHLVCDGFCFQLCYNC